MAAFPFNGMKHPRKHRAARDKTEITHRARARARALALVAVNGKRKQLSRRVAQRAQAARTQGTFYPGESLTAKTTIIDGKRPVHPPRNYRGAVDRPPRVRAPCN
jgi:hypothetical protein